MTDFKVTDEAVEAGLKALHEQYGNRDNSPEDLIRIIIKAVLPVMFEKVGCAVPEELESVMANIDDTAQIYPECSHLEGDCPIYRIKEPK